MNFVFSLLLFALAPVILLTNCNNNQKPDMETELIFHVDSSLVGPMVAPEETGILVHPPKGWTVLDSLTREQLIQNIHPKQAEPQPLRITPLEVYMDSLSQSVFAISRLEFTSSDTAGIRQYQETIENTFSKHSLRKGSFTKKGLYFTQYLIQNNKQVAFKLFTKPGNNRYIQFDYIIPANQYVNQIKAIESSIGSIRQTP
jgi:hypothetical protein